MSRRGCSTPAALHSTLGFQRTLRFREKQVRKRQYKFRNDIFNMLLYYIYIDAILYIS